MTPVDRVNKDSDEDMILDKKDRRKEAIYIKSGYPYARLAQKLYGSVEGFSNTLPADYLGEKIFFVASRFRNFGSSPTKSLVLLRQLSHCFNKIQYPSVISVHHDSEHMCTG